MVHVKGRGLGHVEEGGVFLGALGMGVHVQKRVGAIVAYRLVEVVVIGFFQLALALFPEGARAVYLLNLVFGAFYLAVLVVLVLGVVQVNRECDVVGILFNQVVDFPVAGVVL